MPVVSVSYDLYRGNRNNYQQLFVALKSFPAWCHALESTWFVSSNWGPKEVFDYLRPHVHVNDRLCITPVTINGGWWTLGLPLNVRNWLGTQLNRKIGARVG
jgi:hypothetical protein